MAKFGKNQKKSNFAQRKMMMVRCTYTLIFIAFIGVTVGVYILYIGVWLTCKYSS